MRYGWKPIRIESIEGVRDWWWVVGLRLDDGTRFELVTPRHNKIEVGSPAHMKPLDALGVGRIAWLTVGPNGFEGMVDVFIHRSMCACQVRHIRAALHGDAQCALEIGRGISFGQGRRSGTSADIRYPSFVAWPVARAWLERAAACGLAVATALLEDKIWQRYG
jgi:hypothetical protein